MASNPYVNKVELADGTPVMDITDTTAEAEDVADGEVFYTAAGARSVGTLKTGNTRVWYGTCDTAAATQEKAVTVNGLTVLTAGDVFVITFALRQTYNGTPTMNVNSLGAKAIRRLTGTNATRYEWQNGATVSFIYDGESFVIENGGVATTTYLGRTKLTNSACNDGTSTALVPAALNNICEYMVAGAPVYSASETYAVGDRVRALSQTWECIVPITTPEEWDDNHWRALPALQTQIDNIWGLTVSELLAL